jgi:hypothetical protein
MRTFILLAILGFSINVFAQKESFDLASYIPPEDWKKQVSEGSIQFIREDSARNIYCIISLLKSVPGTADPKENFTRSWETLIKNTVKPTQIPEMQTDTSQVDWDITNGFSPFERDGEKGVVILVTSTGFGKMMNLIILTNTDVYEPDMTRFLESVSLSKPEQPALLPANDNAVFSGIWLKTSSVHEKYGDAVSHGNAGYTTYQYEFNSNGTYKFYTKTFRPSSSNLLLVRESGTYSIRANKLTIVPQKSVIEAWTKKGGSDKWGRLLSSQKRPLEKISYQFTSHYFSGIDQWNLVLQSGKATQRDGPFSTNTTFSNAWYYSRITPNNTAIQLP